MRLGIVTRTEDGSAHTDHGAATADRILKIIRHTHGQSVHAYIIAFFSRYVNTKVAHFLKKFVIIPRILTNWGDCHQSAYLQIGKIGENVKNFPQLLGKKSAFILLPTDIDL